MKPQEQKAEFIRLRAERKSFAAIAQTLHISKSTCTAWERELQEAISELKQEQLNELYNSYFMTKEARIKRLGNTLESINTALAGVDFSRIPPEKLLDYMLKYTSALKEEYVESGAEYRLNPDKAEPKDIVAALGDLLARIRAGEVTKEQASRERAVIATLLKAYETVEIKSKLDAIESILGSRT